MNIDSVHACAAGTVGGIAITLVGHPFDTVKVTLQSNSSSASSVSSTIKNIYQAEGLSGFYAGVQSPLLGQMFFRSIQFLAHHEAKKFCNDTLEISGMKNSALAGGMVGATVVFVETPIDFFKSQRQRLLQVNTGGAPPGMLTIARQLISKYGIGVAYTAFGATAARNIPANVFYWSAFEGVKAHSADGGAKLSTAFLAGAAAGVGYWSLTYPLDVVKSSLMMQSLDNKKYNGWFDCFSKLYKEGGMGRFTRGFTPCITRAVLANAVMLTVVDKTKKFLKGTK